MFEVIDTLLGPLFKLNPFKYALNAAYREKLRKSLGKEPRYVFIYQIVFLVFVLALLVTFLSTR